MTGDVIQAVTDIFSPLGSVNTFYNFLVGLIVAVCMLIVGYVVALIVGHMVTWVLGKAKIDQYFEKGRVADALGHLKMSFLAGVIVKWYVFVLFLPQVAWNLMLGELSRLLYSFVLWLPNLIIAIVIVLFGLIASDFVYDDVTRMKLKGIKFAGSLLKMVIMLFLIIIALEQIGVDVSLAENVFLMIIGSVCLAFGLAVGIGLGLGMKDEAKSIVRSIRGKF